MEIVSNFVLHAFTLPSTFFLKYITEYLTSKSNLQDWQKEQCQLFDIYLKILCFQSVGKQSSLTHTHTHTHDSTLLRRWVELHLLSLKGSGVVKLPVQPRPWELSPPHAAASEETHRSDEDFFNRPTCGLITLICFLAPPLPPMLSVDKLKTWNLFLKRESIEVHEVTMATLNSNQEDGLKCLYWFHKDDSGYIFLFYFLN